MATLKGTRAKKVQATEVQATLESVKDLSLDTVIADVGNLQVVVQNSLSNLGSALASKVKQLETVEDAIAIKQNRLKELFAIEDEAVLIDDLRATREEETKDWQKRVQEDRQRWSEELGDREKSRKREAEEYLYTTKQAQKRIKDEFDAEVARQKREEQIRQEMLTREWEVREGEIAAKEDEFERLQDQVAGFDARIKTEVSKAEAIVGNTLKRQHEHEIELLKKDADISAKMAASQTAMLQGTISNLQDQIRDLQIQLVAARTDAKEVASQALQSASGRQVAEALQRAMDTRDPVSKTK